MLYLCIIYITVWHNFIFVSLHKVAQATLLFKHSSCAKLIGIIAHCATKLTGNIRMAH